MDTGVEKMGLLSGAFALIGPKMYVTPTKATTKLATHAPTIGLSLLDIEVPPVLEGQCLHPRIG